MPDTYTPQNELHETVSMPRGNELHVWDDTPVSGLTPPAPYVKVIIQNAFDNAENARQEALALREEVEATYSLIPVDISPRAFSFFETDGVPDLSWLKYGGVTDDDGADYISDESEVAGQTRTGYATWTAGPGFVGMSSWGLTVYRAAGCSAANVIEVYLYERVSFDNGATIHEKRWVERGHIISDDIDAGVPVWFDTISGDLDPADTGSAWLVVFKITNCSLGEAKFGGVTLLTRNKTLPQGTVL